MSTFLVTGGAGFIGSNLVHGLLDRGHTVRVLDNLATGRAENLADVRRRIDFRDADLRDDEAVRDAVNGCDFVLHHAAMPSVTWSVDNPEESHDVNITGTLGLLLEARDAGVKRVVFAGSSAVYGNAPELPKVESMLPAPASPYAIHKLCAEQYGQVFTSLYGLEVVTLRYFNVFGPRQDPKSDYAAVVPRFIAKMMAGEAPTIFGDGLQTRDFVHVENVVEANLLACKRPGVAGRAFNIAGGTRITLLELVSAMNTILGTRIEPILSAPRPGDIVHSCADIAEARDGLCFNPSVDLAEGLRRTIAWYQR